MKTLSKGGQTLSWLRDKSNILIEMNSELDFSKQGTVKPYVCHSVTPSKGKTCMPPAISWANSKEVQTLSPRACPELHKAGTELLQVADNALSLLQGHEVTATPLRAVDPSCDVVTETDGLLQVMQIRPAFQRSSSPSQQKVPWLQVPSAQSASPRGKRVEYEAKSVKPRAVQQRSAPVRYKHHTAEHKEAEVSALSSESTVSFGAGTAYQMSTARLPIAAGTSEDPGDLQNDLGSAPCNITNEANTSFESLMKLPATTRSSDRKRRRSSSAASDMCGLISSPLCFQHPLSSLPVIAQACTPGSSTTTQHSVINHFGVEMATAPEGTMQLQQMQGSRSCGSGQRHNIWSTQAMSFRPSASPESNCLDVNLLRASLQPQQRNPSPALMPSAASSSTRSSSCNFQGSSYGATASYLSSTGLSDLCSGTGALLPTASSVPSDGTVVFRTASWDSVGQVAAAGILRGGAMGQ